MKFETEKPRPLISAGEHVLKFLGVESKQLDDKFGRSNDGSGKITRNIWQFVSQETDDEGNPFEYGVFTGSAYGNEKAAMTALVDMLVPGMTMEKFSDFDSDDLVGKKFRAQIKHVKKDDGNGVRAVHVYVTPVASKSARPVAKTKEEDDERDPFEDE